MLKFTPEMMKNFADARIKDMEHGWILKELKNAYGSSNSHYEPKC